MTEPQSVPSKILNLVAFVPAENFELSRRFYRDLGFRENWGDDQVCEFELEGYRFLLQNFYVKDHAGNFMMSLLVEDADKWWEYIQSIALPQKYDLCMARPPTLQPWGLRVLYLADPSGVLWHIADRRKT
jgi:catechol 2,3-dioxygenase-like lactoylglutathione lyase family enzyme